MTNEINQSNFLAAELAVITLSRDVMETRINSHHIDISHPHKGKDYQARIIRFADKSNKIEEEFRDRVIEAANEVTALCDTGWEKDSKILNLWHQIAETITGFSEHPTKKVATLIISNKGVLQAFGSNRVPEGAPKRSRHYVEGQRKEFILCSERIALARLLGLKIKLPKSTHASKKEQSAFIKKSIEVLTDKITTEADANNVLRGSFLLTTTSPCETCAHTIAPHVPAAIITKKEAPHHFKPTRQESILLARDYLTQKGIPFIYV